MQWISIRGASEHNLADISLDLPRDALIVFSGVSGSGKSSLAFDTIYREGQRRFLETLSGHSRQILGSIDRPHVELIEGLSPTLSIDQRTSRGRSRSTVGTMTDIHDHLRLLFARLGRPHCPQTGRSLDIASSDEIVREILDTLTGRRALFLAPWSCETRAEASAWLADRVRDGFRRYRIAGRIERVRLLAGGEVEPDVLPERWPANLAVVYDRLRVGDATRGRVAEAVEKCLELGDGAVSVRVDDEERTWRSGGLADPQGEPYPALEPALFSFNSPRGACGRCAGLGETLVLDLGRLAAAHTKVSDVIDTLAYLASALARETETESEDAGPAPRVVDAAVAACEAARADLVSRGIALENNWRSLPESTRRDILGGADGHSGLSRPVEAYLERTSGRRAPSFLKPYVVEATCPRCLGGRLNAFAAAVRFEGRTIVELCEEPIESLRAFFSGLRLEGRHAVVGRPIVEEIIARLGFLEQVGVSYLQLGRGAPTLSGGESQRVRLAGQVGSTLRGVVFVLDEPSIGLHARDNERLLQTLRDLRDRGNTVLVVEHDPATLCAADHIVDLGPGAGEHGGHVVAQGAVADIRDCASSVTGAYLRGDRRVQPLGHRRRPSGWLELVGAQLHNLRGVDVRFPLGVLVAVTGVSGSGKSSLVHGVLRPALARREGSRYETLRGRRQITRVLEIDQKPLGRSPRSNPATYTRIFGPIRELFASTPLARKRRYSPSRFSFNSAEGRCFRCRGAGVVQVEMEILPTVEVVCEECDGKRYDRDTLEVTYRGKSIADVLEMTIEEASAFFADHEEVRPTLDILVRIGLGYIRLGQPASSLSGGEAQRVKLAAELRRAGLEGDLIILDEPTTGLHSEDIRVLLRALQGLVTGGASVIVIEHNLDIIGSADHVIDLGPEGGAAGGRLVACGTPEEIIAAAEDSSTGRALARWQADAGVSPPANAAAPSPGRVRSVETIEITGAGEHNLRGVDVTIERGSFTVVTGVSGSGKSSLAFDTLYAAGQRRYVESLSTFARRFLGRLPTPRVDRIDGLSPAIALDQRPLTASPHSTVGTVTEIAHYLRVLYARVGTGRCPRCAATLESGSPVRIADRLIEERAGERAYLLAPLPWDDRASESSARVATWLAAGIDERESDAWRRLESVIGDGFSRVMVGPAEVRLDEPRESIAESFSRAAAAAPDATVAVVVDRVVLERPQRSRVGEAIVRAFEYGRGRAGACSVEGETAWYSVNPHCPRCDYAMPVEVTPRLFSFHVREGACPACEGTGHCETLVGELLLESPGRPLLEGALATAAVELILPPGSELRQRLESWADDASIDLERPVSQWTAEELAALWRGTAPRGSWEGLKDLLAAWYRRERARLKPKIFARYTRREPCSECGGSRLRREARRFDLGGATIDAVLGRSVDAAAEHFEALELSGERAQIAATALSEVRSRLSFLRQVGLGYLTLERPTATLSGGEAQRIRLASHLAHRLVDVIYVLDEPTVGLHPRDTARLLETLRELQAAGNTLVVVEHDRDTIEQADRIIDLGPGAGPRGGRVVATGNPAAMRRHRDSLTGRYLRGERAVERSSTPRAARGMLTLRGVRRHNLRDVDVQLPLGCLTAVTGVSGSGKSTLALEVLAAALRESIDRRRPPGRGRRRGATASEPVVGRWLKAIEGDASIGRLARVDQSALGRSPRSNPATYIGAWEAIRRFYAQLPRSRMKGFDATRFSFNQPGGRCEACKGEGATRVDMHFLSDVWLTCDVCGGRRFNEQTLAVRYRGRSIGDLLDTTVEEALELFADHPAVARPLGVLRDVGLGYLELGQSATTLSGGEAQRVKLAAELARPRGDDALFLLDEPTTGLHFEDVRVLLGVLDRLVDAGATVIVVEHNLDLIAACDWMVDLGPEGGEAGGRVVASGTPADVAGSGVGHTAKFLARRASAGSARAR